MNVKYLLILGGVLYLPLSAMAEDSLPPLPPLPNNGPFNPTLPFATPEPIQPLAPNIINAPTNSSGTTLPSLNDDDAFDFFQPGAQGELALPALENDDATEDITDAPPSAHQRKATRHPHRIPLHKRFNYKIQTLPQTIYKKEYSGKNKHLPIAQYEMDYDRATFVAAANNNVNGLRAMLEHGGRYIGMTNAYGETLVQTAIRYRAYEAARYLLAIGAPRGDAQAVDGMSHYALNAGR